LTHTAAFWTEERIIRLEQALQRERGDVQIDTFISRLAHAQDLEQRRMLFTNDLLPVLLSGQVMKLWEGNEIPLRLALRDMVQDFLYRERFAENRPSNEPDTPAEAAERLAQVFGEGTPASQIVIDDRGPR
jgi:hypothetical protein